jgi:hypothetical protein
MHVQTLTPEREVTPRLLVVQVYSKILFTAAICPDSSYYFKYVILLSWRLYLDFPECEWTLIVSESLFTIAFSAICINSTF